MSVIDDLVAIAAGAGMADVYAVGSVPPGPSYPYAVIGADTGADGQRRLGGGATRKDRRVTVQIFGRTDDSVLVEAEKADSVFRDKVLGTLPRRPFSIRELQTAINRDPDGGAVLNILHTYKLLET